jgi:protein-tyrosine phosphatase
MCPVQHDAYRFAPAAPEADHVYGACAPGWHSAGSHERALERWVGDMQRFGIARVCCLVAAPPSEARTATLGRYSDAFGRENVLHAPVPADRLVEETRLREDVFPFLADAVAADERVVVHGLAGVGRTGQVLAAWLVHHHEYHPPEAVDTVREMGRDPREAIEYGDATSHGLLCLLAQFE